jgi:putative CocE/NonD family hydrolase
MKNYLARILVFTFLTIPLVLAASENDYSIKQVKSNMVPMRDGTRLSTDIYIPEGADGKLPVILLRTVYGKNTVFDNSPALNAALQRGYVVAVQDVRGRYESEGDYVIATGRREDGYDTVDWLIAQDWSNQKVATAGCSYLGETQVVLAAAKHPNHLAAVPMSPASGYYAPGRAWQAFDGGVFELGQTAGWFAGSGTKVFLQPPASIDRQEWFRSPAAKLYKQDPEIDFSKYLPFLKTLPTYDLLKRAGLPPTDYELWVSSLPDSGYFREMDFVQASDSVDVPMLFMDSWYDYGAAETLAMFNQFQKKGLSERSRNNQFIIIGPSTHCGYPYATENTIVGERELGDARLDFFGIQLDWYDYWLKGIDNGVTNMPKIQYYLMGKNAWRSADQWPLDGTVYTKLYLDSGGEANSRMGDGVLLFSPPERDVLDQFVYDPATPVPSLGGHTCCTGTDTEAGGYDQSTIEMRDDILVYTSEVLGEGIEVTGPLKVVLQVSSSAVDTDFTAKLVDVYPDGRAFNIQEGALRMRFRESLSKKVLMTPGEVYEIELDLHASSNYYAEGHRIRLEVSSSNFPRWERNLNTGGNNFDETEWKTATNRVHHSKKHLSYVVLPVIKGG